MICGYNDWFNYLTDCVCVAWTQLCRSPLQDSVWLRQGRRLQARYEIQRRSRSTLMERRLHQRVMASYWLSLGRKTACWQGGNKRLVMPNRVHLEVSVDLPSTWFSYSFWPVYYALHRVRFSVCPFVPPASDLQLRATLTEVSRGLSRNCASVAWGLLKFESRVSSIKNGRIRCFLLIQLKLETWVWILETRYSIEQSDTVQYGTMEEFNVNSKFSFI